MTARAARGTPVTLAEARRSVSVRRVEDRRRLHEILERSPAFNAYALAYLDASLFLLATFYVAESNGASALLMQSRGGLGPATHVFGEARLVPALVALHPGVRGSMLTCQTDHIDPLLQAYNLWRPQTMLRMRVDGESFAPPAERGPVRRLLAADAPELNRLYSLEGDGLTYSGRHLREGVYFGALHRGRLVAAAGTHIYSRTAGVAVVGNVFTHPDFRGRGLAAACTAAVTSHALDECELVVLSVDPANRSARHIYEKLGYQETGRLVEATATRRRPFSPLPVLRRLLAARRSPERGVEVVRL